jgi:hypothetical protein
MPLIHRPVISTRMSAFSVVKTVGSILALTQQASWTAGHAIYRRPPCVVAMNSQISRMNLLIGPPMVRTLFWKACCS